jgi:hypothetical protein
VTVAGDGFVTFAAGKPVEADHGASPSGT